MGYTGGMKALLLAAALAAPAAPAAAGPKGYEPPSREKLAKALKRVHKRNPTVSERVPQVSALFLGAPYRLGPLGEGEKGEYDRDPLWRLDAFDCTTLVETVMALAADPDPDRALDKTLQRIRYKEGVIGYTTRNHFPETDWIPQNAWAGFLKDITAELAPGKVKQATKLIAKKAWYEAKTADDIQGFPDAGEREKRLRRLKREGDGLLDQTASVPYIPMDALPQLLPRIAPGTIANLVREDQPDKPVLVSHQVLIVEKDGLPHVRHAAFGKAVEDVPALEYFYRYYGSGWRLLGLNFNRPLAPRGLERSAR